MATTTNYGWTTPDDTSLVKDGAAAIRTLGSSIDTSLNTALGTRKAGMVLLNTTSFSAVASQSVNDVFSATYDRYIIQFNATKSTSSNIQLRFRVSGADNTTTNYGYQFIRGTGTSVTGNAVNASSFVLNVDDTQNQADTLNVFSPFLTEHTMIQDQSITGVGGSSAQLVVTGGRLGLTTSFTGFSLIASAGTITGSVSVFGVNK